MTLAVYPGSFDPFTLGHRDILLRSLKIFDQVVIAVGVNQNKKTLFTAEERVEMIEKEINDIKLDKNNVVKVECFEGLIVDLASKHKAKSLIKGVRGPVDYDYEAQMAGMNTVMCPDLETIFLMSKPEFSFIHSSLVKQISLMGGDVTGFVSQSIKNQLKTKS